MFCCELPAPPWLHPEPGSEPGQRPAAAAAAWSHPHSGASPLREPGLQPQKRRLQTCCCLHSSWAKSSNDEDEELGIKSSKNHRLCNNPQKKRVELSFFHVVPAKRPMGCFFVCFFAFLAQVFAQRLMQVFDDMIRNQTEGTLLSWEVLTCTLTRHSATFWEGVSCPVYTATARKSALLLFTAGRLMLLHPL